jgi:hypothetical protein
LAKIIKEAGTTEDTEITERKIFRRREAESWNWRRRLHNFPLAAAEAARIIVYRAR